MKHLWLAGLAGTFALISVAGVSGQSFPAERLTLAPESKSVVAQELAGSVVVTDLSASHAGNWFRGTPLCTVPAWVKLPAGRYLVRHRLAVDCVGTANVSLWSEVYRDDPKAGQVRCAWARWMGTDFTKPGEFQILETVVDLTAAAAIQPRLLWRRSTKEPGDIRQVKLAAIEIVPAPQPLVITDVLASKVHYKEKEKGTGFVLVLNNSDAARTGRVRVRLLRDLDTDGAVVFDKPLEVAARGTARVEVTFAKFERYGYELRAEVMDDKGAAMDARSDFFTVADNVLEVGMSSDTPFVETCWGAFYPLGHKDRQDNWYATLPVWVDAIRRRFANTAELFAWAPADCVKLVPPGEDWLSGQTKYPESVTRTHKLIDEFHRHGMTMQIYIQCLWGCDDDGSYQQEHPDYFAYNADGQPQGFNLFRAEPVDDHIKGLLGTIEMFGWDGARWDGHFDYVPPYNDLRTLFGEKLDTSPRDAQVAAINERIRGAVNAKFPLFTWGYNWNENVENLAASQEIRSICAGGSWIMNEAIKDSESPGSGTHQWRQYAERIVAGSRVVRKHGGLYLTVAPPQYFQAGSQVLYKGLLVFAARSYLYGGMYHDRAPLEIDLAAFVTRYARYLRGREFEDVAEAERWVQVAAPQEVWWKGYLSQRMSREGVEQVLGLVNPPAVPAVTTAPEGTLPAVQRNLAVTFQPPPKMRRAQVTLLSPDRRPFQVELTVEMKNGAAAVVVPELRYWDVLVIRWTR